MFGHRRGRLVGWCCWNAGEPIGEPRMRRPFVSSYITESLAMDAAKNANERDGRGNPQLNITVAIGVEDIMVRV